MWKSLHHMTDNDSLIHLPLTHYKQSQWPHFPSRAPSLNYLIWWVASLLLWKQEFYENQTMNTLERLLNLCVYPLQWLLWDAIKTFKMFFFASDCPTLMFEKIEILHSVNNIWWGLCVCPPESPGTFLSPASCQTIFKCIGCWAAWPGLASELRGFSHSQVSGVCLQSELCRLVLELLELRDIWYFPHMAHTHTATHLLPHTHPSLTVFHLTGSLFTWCSWHAMMLSWDSETNTGSQVILGGGREGEIW